MKKWFVLEWNGLDAEVALYEWPSSKRDEAEVCDEVGESLHNFSSFLLMDYSRLRNMLKAISAFRDENKHGEPRNG